MVKNTITRSFMGAGLFLALVGLAHAMASPHVSLSAPANMTKPPAIKTAPVPK